MKKYQLFLFDFDGLLVNTEQLHHEAYERLCVQYGFKLNWSFARYCAIAHRSSQELRDTISAEHPELHHRESDWEVLYKQKCRIYLDLIKEGQAHLMPGAAAFLEQLTSENIKRAVVTHSPLEQIEIIRSQNPILNNIPHWITRDQYAHPKPHPESYMKAIDRLAAPYEEVIGFEDSHRGLAALRGTLAQAVAICAADYPHLAEMQGDQVLHFHSLEECLKHL
jgi:HAD superfamily hydrolase (TIGR01509 family)